MLLHTWAPACLRRAGLQVVETSGWTNRSHGSFPDSIAGTWHHDASPPGDSPGALNWMIDNWPNASANFWVNRQGVWYCVGTGVAYHAGTTLPGMPNNFNSFGVETDQTVDEVPSAAMINSVREGFAALLSEMGRNAQSLNFHKTVAKPVGRKRDPWFSSFSNVESNWPEELASERSDVQKAIEGELPPVPPTPLPNPDLEDDMPRRILRIFDGQMNQLGEALDGPTGVVIFNTPYERDCVKAVIDSDDLVNTVQIDVYNAVLSRGVAPKS